MRPEATGTYRLDDQVNATFTGSGNQYAVLVEPDIASQDIGTLLVTHSYTAVFDCTGSDCIEFRSVCIRTQSGAKPKVGILWARNNGPGNNSQVNRLRDCRIIGSFTVACLYNYGSEDDVLIGNYFDNTCTDAGTACAIWTANNIAALSSPFTTIATGSQSTIDHNLFGNQFFNQAGTSTSDCIVLEGVAAWKSYGGWARSAAASANGRALIYEHGERHER